MIFGVIIVIAVVAVIGYNMVIRDYPFLHDDDED